MDVGVLLISTWKYNRFINNTIKGIRKHFPPSKVYLHTDSNQKHDADVIIPIKHQHWPHITLNRFKLFTQSQYDVDYLFYVDVDVDVIGEIDIKSDFFVTRHYLYLDTTGTPERNPKSTAYIAPYEKNTYVAGGFFGGKKDKFINACHTMKNNIETDLKNNIIAIWHDESHLNKYAFNNNATIVDHKYLCINEWTKQKRNDVRIIPYCDKRKGFNKIEIQR